MTPTVKSLVDAARTAAQNQVTAQTATKAAVAAIAAQRGTAGRPAPAPAGGQNESHQ